MHIQRQLVDERSRDDTGQRRLGKQGLHDFINPAGRNLRNVWNIATHPYIHAHFATSPPALVERCIRAGTSERGCCAACGAPYIRITDTPKIPAAMRNRDGTKMDYHTRQVGGGQRLQDWRDANPTTTTGWRAGCQCGTTTEHFGPFIPADPVPCTVLDPFLGSGTTALVADRLQRHCIGIDLSFSYADLARNRVTADCPLFTSWAPVPGCGGSGGRAPGEEGVLDRRCPEHPVETPEDARMADLFAGDEYELALRTGRGA
jgi:hypothetical protein